MSCDKITFPASELNPYSSFSPKFKEKIKEWVDLNAPITALNVDAFELKELKENTVEFYIPTPKEREPSCQEADQRKS